MVWHDMRLSKWWQNYHFGRNIALSHLCSCTIKVWSLTAASYLPLQTVGAGGQTWFQEAGGCGPACGIFSGRFFGLRTRLREWHRCQVQQCRIATATNMQRHVCEKKRDQWVTEGQSFHSSGTFRRPRLHYESLHLSLTGSKRGCGNLYLAVGQVRLEGRQWGGGGRLSREELRRLGACWARAGAVTSDMRLLFVKHCHQLQRETETERGVYI